MKLVTTSTGKALQLSSGKYVTTNLYATLDFTGVSIRDGCIPAHTSAYQHFLIDCMDLSNTINAEPYDIADGCTIWAPLPMCSVHWFRGIGHADDNTCTRMSDALWSDGSDSTQKIEVIFDSANNQIVVQAWKEFDETLLGADSAYKILIFYGTKSFCDVISAWPNVTVNNALLSSSSPVDWTGYDSTAYIVGAYDGSVTVGFTCSTLSLGADTCGCCGRPACIYSWTYKQKASDCTMVQDVTQDTVICASTTEINTLGAWYSTGIDGSGNCILKYYKVGVCCPELTTTVCDENWPAAPPRPTAVELGRLCCAKKCIAKWTATRNKATNATTGPTQSTLTCALPSTIPLGRCCNTWILVTEDETTCNFEYYKIGGSCAINGDCSWPADPTDAIPDCNLCEDCSECPQATFSGPGSTPAFTLDVTVDICDCGGTTAPYVDHVEFFSDPFPGGNCAWANFEDDCGWAFTIQCVLIDGVFMWELTAFNDGVNSITRWHSPITSCPTTATWTKSSEVGGCILTV